MMYGSECWCLRKEDERRILVAGMNWLRRILGRSRRDRIRNEITRKELGLQVTLVDKIRKRRLTWFGHVTKMKRNRLYGVAQYRQMEGTRSRGRQPKKWIDNVKENLTAQGMNMREAVGNSRNRRIWISLVESLSPGASSTRCVQYQMRPVPGVSSTRCVQYQVRPVPGASSTCKA